jgi:hypothetical protein
MLAGFGVSAFSILMLDCLQSKRLPVPVPAINHGASACAYMPPVPVLVPASVPKLVPVPVSVPVNAMPVSMHVLCVLCQCAWLSVPALRACATFPFIW